MKKHQIRVGALYRAVVSKKEVTVRVDSIQERENFRGRHLTLYYLTNLSTGRKTVFRSAGKFKELALATTDNVVSNL